MKKILTKNKVKMRVRMNLRRMKTILKIALEKRGKNAQGV
jgi:hypothetical protein